MPIRFPTRLTRQIVQPDIMPERMPHYLAVGTCAETGHEIVLYRGPNIVHAKHAVEHAKLLGVQDAALIGIGLLYPAPQHNTDCRCAGYSLKAGTCLHGHEHECHYPLTCVQADCEHLKAYRQGDPDRLAERVTIRDEDRKWRDSPDAGPLCLCSRCGEPITDEPLRIEDAEQGGEWRYHMGCVG